MKISLKGSSVSLASSSVKDWTYYLDSLLSVSNISYITCILCLNWIILSSHSLSSSLPALWHDICLLQYQHVEDRSILYSWTAWTCPFQPFLYCLYDREGIPLWLMISCPLKYLSGYGLYHILPAGAFLFSATAVMPYISSYSIYMVGVTDKFHFFYFYIFYFRSECGKIIFHKYKFLSYVFLAKT